MLSDAQLRQYIKYARARVGNAQDELREQDERLATIEAALDERLEVPEPEPAPDPEPPASVSPLFADDFSGSPVGSRPGYEHQPAAETGGRWRLAQTKDKDGVYVADIAGRRCLVFDYAGREDPCEDAWAEARFVLERALQELWIEYDVFIPTDYAHRIPRCPERGDPDGLQANNKFLSLWGGDYKQAQIDGAWVGLGLRPFGEGDSYFETMSTIRNEPHVRGHLLRPVVAGINDSHRGQWNKLRFHARLGTTGVVEAWFGGVLIGRYEGPVGSADPARDYLDEGYLFGWRNASSLKREICAVADFRVYDVDPGW